MFRSRIDSFFCYLAFQKLLLPEYGVYLCAFICGRFLIYYLFFPESLSRVQYVLFIRSFTAIVCTIAALVCLFFCIWFLLKLSLRITRFQFLHTNHFTNRTQFTFWIMLKFTYTSFVRLEHPRLLLESWLCKSLFLVQFSIIINVHL